MSIKQLTLAWIASITAFALFCAFVFYVSSHTPLVIPPTDLDDVEVVVIGSSMTHAALPPAGTFVDDRIYTKYSIDQMSKAQSLAMLKHVVNHGVPTVILEANDYLYDIVVSPWYYRVAAFGVAMGAQFRRGLNLLEGSPIVDIRLREKDFSKMKKALKAKGEKFEPPYKVLIRENVDAELAGIVGQARENQTDIILVVPPLPKYFYEKFDGVVDAGARQAERLEQSLGVRIWKPDAAWDNELFFDPAHLNYRGRERFVGEFKSWLQSEP